MKQKKINKNNVFETINSYIISCSDWSSESIENFPNKVPAAMNAESTNCFQMGIYTKDFEKYYSSGFVGIGRIREYNGEVKKIVGEDGKEKEVVLRILPRFNIDPWEMLAEVMQDNEYNNYIGDDPERFFHIELEESSINIPTKDDGGEMLLAMSFISACYEVCKKNLKPKITFVEENCSGKVKGKILFSKHLKKNVIILFHML